MKKTIAIVLAALMALTMLAACAKKDSKAGADPLVGTWTVDFASMISEEQKAAMEQMGMTLEQALEQMGMSLDQFKVEFTFNADGTGKAIMEMNGESHNADFTYTAKDGKLEMKATVDGETNTQTTDYKLDGDTLTMTVENQTMTFKRK